VDNSDWIVCAVLNQLPLHGIGFLLQATGFDKGSQELYGEIDLGGYNKIVACNRLEISPVFPTDIDIAKNDVVKLT
jgi:hypothetical protein